MSKTNNDWNFKKIKTQVETFSSNLERLNYLKKILEDYEKEQLEKMLISNPLTFAIQKSQKDLSEIGQMKFTEKLKILIKHYEKNDHNFEKNIQINSNPRLIWNGKKNTLADVFYQLKKMNGSNNQPYLEGSDTDIAIFLKNNFECFKDNSIETILNYFRREDSRPKLGKNKLTIVKGFPNKE